jgi:dTDP-4-dehydrorhamnose reductase
MRWLVTGAGGLLGKQVVRQLTSYKELVVGLDRSNLDITDPGSVIDTLDAFCPAVVINCAAYTAVEDAESNEMEAYRVNGDGPRCLAEACSAHGARLIHISTDYVFSGEAQSPYLEYACPAPSTAYGRTKLAGERAVLSTLDNLGIVVRTSWLYGAGGNNFVRTIIGLAAEREFINVVDDQYGQPTWASDAAAIIIRLGKAPNASGIYHATNSGETTWCGLAREAFILAGTDPTKIRPTKTEALVGRAPRPSYTVLAHHRLEELGIKAPRHWRYALADAIDCRDF